ncbi:hypothetical protein [Pedobacter sp. P26]|uniref:hypothetical protein n=1 Tax=Pedobacter sp. P26 TaxID=3423956 RepID=UPI003D66F98C
MKTLTCTTPGTFEYSETEKPALKKITPLLKLNGSGSAERIYMPLKAPSLF